MSVYPPGSGPPASTPQAEGDGADERATRLAALGVASLSSFLTPFMLSSVNIALPSIGDDFQADAVLLSWVATAYLLAAAVSLVPLGKLADIHGRKKIHLWGTVLFSLMSLLCGLSGSVEALIFFRVFQGIGIAMIFATGIAILTSVFPLAERGRVLGISVAAVYAGLSCGPLAGGWLTEQLSWRSIFLINAALGAFVVYVILTKLKGEWAGARGERFDLCGALIYAAAIIGFMVGFSELPSVHGAVLLAGGCCGLAVFVRWELRVQSPVFEVRLFTGSRVFTYSCLAALIHYSATYGVTFLMSLYLQYIKGLSPELAGLVLIAQPVVMAAFSPFAGKLSDRIEPRVIATLGMGVTVLGLVLLTFVGSGTALWFIIVSLLALGFGFALFSSPNMNAIMSSVEKKYYGIASGSVGTMRLLGQMLSMGITTMIFSVLIGRAQITPENHPAFIDSVHTALLSFCALCVIGLFFSMSRGQLRQNREAERSG
jgi:EmrB/QacA subfamily drug resistance transporter